MQVVVSHTLNRVMIPPIDITADSNLLSVPTIFIVPKGAALPPLDALVYVNGADPLPLYLIEEVPARVGDEEIEKYISENAESVTVVAADRLRHECGRPVRAPVALPPASLRAATTTTGAARRSGTRSARAGAAVEEPLHPNTLSLPLTPELTAALKAGASLTVALVPAPVPVKAPAKPPPAGICAVAEFSLDVLSCPDTAKTGLLRSNLVPATPAAVAALAERAPALPAPDFRAPALPATVDEATTEKMFGDSYMCLEVVLPAPVTTAAAAAAALAALAPPLELPAPCPPPANAEAKDAVSAALAAFRSSIVALRDATDAAHARLATAAASAHQIAVVAGTAAPGAPAAVPSAAEVALELESTGAAAHLRARVNAAAATVAKVLTAGLPLGKLSDNVLGGIHARIHAVLLTEAAAAAGTAPQRSEVPDGLAGQLHAALSDAITSGADTAVETACSLAQARMELLRASGPAHLAVAAAADLGTCLCLARDYAGAGAAFQMALDGAEEAKMALETPDLVPELHLVAAFAALRRGAPARAQGHVAAAVAAAPESVVAWTLSSLVGLLTYNSEMEELAAQGACACARGAGKDMMVQGDDRSGQSPLEIIRSTLQCVSCAIDRSLMFSLSVSALSWLTERGLGTAASRVIAAISPVYGILDNAMSGLETSDEHPESTFVAASSGTITPLTAAVAAARSAHGATPVELADIIDLKLAAAHALLQGGMSRQAVAVAYATVLELNSLLGTSTQTADGTVSNNISASLVISRPPPPPPPACPGPSPALGTLLGRSPDFTPAHARYGALTTGAARTALWVAMRVLAECEDAAGSSALAHSTIEAALAGAATERGPAVLRTPAHSSLALSVKLIVNQLSTATPLITIYAMSDVPAYAAGLTSPAAATTAAATASSSAITINMLRTHRSVTPQSGAQTPAPAPANTPAPAPELALADALPTALARLAELARCPGTGGRNAPSISLLTGRALLLAAQPAGAVAAAEQALAADGVNGSAWLLLVAALAASGDAAGAAAAAAQLRHVELVSSVGDLLADAAELLLLLHSDTETAAALAVRGLAVGVTRAARVRLLWVLFTIAQLAQQPQEALDYGLQLHALLSETRAPWPDPRAHGRALAWTLVVLGRGNEAAKYAN